MAIPPDHGLQFSPPPMPLKEIADQVWIKAREIFTANVEEHLGRTLPGRYQPAYNIFLMGAGEECRLISWQRGIDNLAMPSLRENSLDQILPFLQRRLEEEIQAFK